MADGLLSLQLFFGCLQVRLGLLGLAVDGLQLGVVFLQTVEFNEAGFQSFFSVLVFHLHFFPLVEGCVPLFLVPLASFL